MTQSTVEYPTKNLFCSPHWQERVKALSLDAPVYSVNSVRGLKVAQLRSGLWNDFEEWPEATAASDGATVATASGHARADWVVHRKLLMEQTSPERITSFLS